jgi:hypothetical protein
MTTLQSKHSSTKTFSNKLADWWLLAVLLSFTAAASVGWFAPSANRNNPQRSVASVVANHKRMHELVNRPIQDIRVGERVLGLNPDRDEVDHSLPEPDQKTWRLLQLAMLKADGDRLDIELLRPLDWLAARGAAVGRTIHLDLSELGAEGAAEVLAIEPCPPIPAGLGRVVTATFAHGTSSQQLLNLQVEGEAEPIGVTENHPIWSQTREEFVPAGKLEVGEVLLTRTGSTKIISIIPRGPPEPVYNLEVHGEHVYHVAASGVLVHNACPQGRQFRTDQLETYQFDSNQPKHVRGWLANERRRIQGSGGGPDVPRNPPGYVQAHGRTTPAREGFDYSNSRLQGADLNALEENMRRRLGRQ